MKRPWCSECRISNLAATRTTRSVGVARRGIPLPRMAGGHSCPASRHDPHLEPTRDTELCLCCPVCFTPFTPKNSLSCSRCGRQYTEHNSMTADPAHPVITDLTINRSLTGPQSVELFKNPFISAIYQRGWRQGFAWAGFPGVEEEAARALEVFRRTRPSVLVDLSCGSGLFCKVFVDSGEFKRVIAVDYSRSMLEETRNNGNGASTAATATTLIQADAARLPFETGSIEAIHAGAAIHCWPDPVNAAAEISRVLCPDKGVFVGTTFLGTVAPLGELLGDDALLKPFRQFEPAPNTFRWWYEDELRQVFEDCGLEFEVINRSNRCVRIKRLRSFHPHSSPLVPTRPHSSPPHHHRFIMWACTARHFVLNTPRS